MSGCTAACTEPSQANAHCSVCHRTFGSPSGFDKHRQMIGGPKVGRRGVSPSGPLNECVDPATLGMTERGGVWRTVMSTEDKQRRWGNDDE